ncbi:MAG TPA: four helix bundle protein [Terracidiphilus sp.]|jgi:four helix bundle protein|nr:four helix bundle protein [Terracidiphilus sp.]
MAQDHHDLIVWQRAIELTVSIYSLTLTFPKQEMYGLTSQMRRASVSVASNIAEGRGRLNRAEFRQFLGLAQGSIFELNTQLVVANRLGLATKRSISDAHALANEVSKMIRSFIRTLNQSS